MTEDEMKQTWCPHIRAMAITSGSGSVAAGNMVFEPAKMKLEWDGFNCLGRACSQWRWDDVRKPVRRMKP